MQERLWGTYRGYGEAELVTNRASLLLYGGSATERRAWAEEVQHHFEQEGPLREVGDAGEVAAALEQPRGVLYLPDACALGLEAQGQVLRCLQLREERPKIIVGLATAPMVAVERGTLREDLLYRLQMAQVDLSIAETREAIRARRQTAGEAASAQGEGKVAVRVNGSKPGAKHRPPAKASSKKPVRVVVGKKAEKR